MATRTRYNETSTSVAGDDFMGQYDDLLKILFDASTLHLTSAAGTDTYTADVDPDFDADNLVDGMHFTIKWPNANTGSSETLNIDSVGAKSIVKNDGSALASGDLVQDGYDLLLYHSNKFYVLSGGGNSNSTVFDHQVFTESGTWNKPVGLNADRAVLIQCWGGGGGGGTASGGGGGAFSEYLARAGDLSSSYSVTIGAGGAAGVAGGNTTFGSLVTAYGGGPGFLNIFGGGGGELAAGAREAGGSIGGGSSPGADASSIFGGAAGMDTRDHRVRHFNGGAAIYGGGGGGYTSGGASLHAGNGGASSSAGSTPSGGGGFGAAGGSGKCIVVVL